MRYITLDEFVVGVVILIALAGLIVDVYTNITLSRELKRALKGE